MKFHLFAAAAAVALAISGQTADALSKEDAVAMRDALQAELVATRKEDRKHRIPKPPEGGKPLVGPEEQKTRALRKLKQVKVNILSLAEEATEEDLDKMLGIYDEMEAILSNQEYGDGKIPPAKSPEVRALRESLDSAAAAYGGLRRGRRHLEDGPEFSPEDAERAKELREQIKRTSDPEEKKAMRKQLQSMFANRKSKDGRRRARSEREEVKERRAARKKSRDARKQKGDPKIPQKQKVKSPNAKPERKERGLRADRGKQAEAPTN